MAVNYAKRLASLWLASLTILCLVMPAAAAAKRAPACDARPGTTAAASDQVRVYWNVLLSADRERTGRIWRVCDRRTRRVTSDWAYDNDLSPLKIVGAVAAGRFAAYLRAGVGIFPGGEAYLVIFAPGESILKTNQVEVHEVGTASATLSMNRRGFVVWAEAVPEPDGGFKIMLARWDRAVPAGGPGMTLDSGPGIDPGSLAISDRAAYWLKDGVAQTIPLGQ